MTVLRTRAREDGRLPEDAVEAFRRDGVVVVEGFVSIEACERLRARAMELCEVTPEQVTVFSTHDQRHARDAYFEESAGRISFFFEEDGKSINKMGHAMHDLDPVFEDFSHGPRLRAVASSIGLEPLVVQSMYIFKHPGVGGEVTCHQDSTYLYTRPMSVTGFWFAIDDATRENGCLEGLVGEHRKGLKSLFHRVDGALRTDVLDASIEWDESRAELLEVERGTLVLFDGCFPHRSAANRSARSRHAYTLHAIDRAAEYPADNWLQRDAPFRGF